MPDKKLTDAEIVKALEICSTYKGKCTDCHAFVNVDRSNCKKVLLGAVEIINRQKEEIERCKQAVKDMAISSAKILEMRDETRAEAYKEFAERLCEGRVSNDPVVIAVKCELKEMVGEDK